MSIQYTEQHAQAALSETNDLGLARALHRAVADGGRIMIGRERIALAVLGLILACAVLVTASQTFARQSADVRKQSANATSASVSQQPTVAVFRFAARSEATDAAAPSSQPCSQYASDAKPSARSNAPDKLTVDPQILDSISNEFQKELSKKKMAVMLGPDADAIPVGSVVVCGRIFKAQKGNPVGRMLGFGLGASRLYAHVVLLSKTESGFTPMDSFDLKLKGRNLLPPGISTAVIQAAFMERRQKLPALARKLADRVVKRLDGDLKRPRLAAKDDALPAKEVSR
jgi:hypothetical protein